MTRFSSFLYVALFVSLVLASPISQQKKRSFRVPVIPNPHYRPHGPRAYKRALNKFGFNDITFKDDGDIATRLKAASNMTTPLAENTQDGAVATAGTQNDAQFLSPVTIGGQELIMNFDSGSSDTWIFNTNLPASAQQGHTVYDPTKSSTFKNLLADSTFNVTYGDGSAVSGPVGVDTVDIGGSTVAQQAIGLPDVVSESFIVDSQSNGLVGLAFSKLNTIEPQRQNTFFENVLPDLSQPVFTAQLLGGKIGAYEFGRIDSSAFTGELARIPVDSSEGFWKVQADLANVNGRDIPIDGGSAIIDTGTSLMLVQEQMVVGYYNQVQGAELNQQVGGIIFPCNAALPDLKVRIGDSYVATIPGSGMNFAEVGTDTQTGEAFCFGGLQSNQGVPFAIYGDVFFKSQFVAFQGGNDPSIGIAPHV
ncbi:Aspartic protease PEP3 [Cyphellophora attinorum]|uniref:Aspartic protease PEP3 n=1 Tax=Cyphellophora attinorum TaxID=1664694 RepID=A0A0N0NKG7_9EURO|nr:Aspartic protease PEP3 [Phialophora attinorum]KPI38111.1 Aspartic protease PEP3 [Phialophora attinorum]